MNFEPITFSRRATLSGLTALTMSVGMAGFAVAEEGPKITWKLSHTTDPNSVYQVAAEAFKAHVEAETDGRFSVNIFHSSQLGWEREVLEAMQIGTIEATIPALGPFATFVPAYDVFSLPFVFRGADHMIEAFKQPGMEKLKESAAGQGFVVAKHFLPTFRYPMNSQHAIETPEDLEGLKIRTMAVPAHIDTYSAYGANVTTMAFSEVYGALQLGAVDGVENFFTNLYTMKFQEQAKYISDIPVVNNAAAIVFSSRAFDKLPASYQKIVQDGAEIAGDKANEMAISMEAESLEKLEEAGVTVTHVEDLTPFMEISAPVAAKYVGEMEPWVAELYKSTVNLGQ